MDVDGIQLFVYFAHQIQTIQVLRMLKVGRRQGQQRRVKDTVSILEVKIFCNQSLEGQGSSFVGDLLLDQVDQVVHFDIATLKGVEFSLDLPVNLILLAYIHKSVEKTVKFLLILIRT